MLENTEGAMKNGQSRETGNIGQTKRRKTKTHHHTPTTLTTLIRHDSSCMLY